jgi:hypothetical protein
VIVVNEPRLFPSRALPSRDRKEVGRPRNTPTRAGVTAPLRSRLGNETIGNETIGNETIGNETIGNETIGNETIGNEAFGNKLPLAPKGPAVKQRRSSEGKAISPGR